MQLVTTVIENFIKRLNMLKTYELFEQAKKEVSENNLNLAIDYFEKCLKDENFVISSSFELAKIYFEQQNYEKVISFLQKVIKAPTIKSEMLNEAYMMLLKVSKFQNNKSQRFDLLSDILKFDTKDYFVHEVYDITNIFYSQHLNLYEYAGDIKELYKWFNIIKHFLPQNSKDLLNLVRISNFLGEYEFTKEILFDNVLMKEEKVLYYKNALLNEFEVAQGKVLLQSHPRCFWISLSNKCNLNCFMCRTHEQKEWFLDKEDIEYIYSCFPYLEYIVWWGGEPTIINGFKEILLDSLKYSNIKHRIITNGQYLSDELVDIILQHDIEVVFSIDYIDKEEYEKVRKGANFDLLINNIKKLSGRIKKELLKMNVVSTIQNQKNNDRMIDFAKRYNFGNVNFIPIGGCGNAIKPAVEKDIVKKTSKENNLLVNNAIEIFNDERKVDNDDKKDLKNIEIKKENCEIENQKKDGSENLKESTNNSVKFCNAPWQQLCIDYLKNISIDPLCNNFYNLKVNLNEFKLRDVWNSKQMQEYRRHIMNIKKCHLDCPKFGENK